jgi:hypothetical protein
MEHMGTIPEWVAAIALLGQAGVFVWQTRIFKHHATSQKLIADVLKKLEEIMGRLETMAGEAASFTRRMAVKEEREGLFDCIQSMKEKVVLAIEKTKVSSESKQGVQDMDAAWLNVGSQSIACQKELIKLGLPPELKNFFLEYAIKALAIAEARSPGSANAQPLVALNTEYKDYGKKMIEVAQIPIDV